ncbi:MAG TPA: L,D-transpeptidase [Phycisphaerae bacterium]|nr:L,D-transpeptidase [Phycisphaerae bacterium]
MSSHRIRACLSRRHRPAPLVILLMVLPAVAAEPSSESALRRGIAWQVALDRVGYSPGLIDGNVGPKTHLATAEFQRVHGLPRTGQLDPTTASALKIDPDNVLGRYVIQQADLDEIGPVPKSWLAKSRLKRLGHEALDQVLGEKFHCTRDLLARLNPGKAINSLRPGDKVVVPIVPTPESSPKAAYIEVNLADKVIRVIDEQQRLAALFHCSVAADKAKLPARDGRVVCVVEDPWYTFDPEMWKEVKERVPGKLPIPPGPKNPVGRCWIGLSLPGYGMHGTPNPELIGKTGSHGCFRLTNWDALRLARMLKPGTPVKFVNQPSTVLARR